MLIYQFLKTRLANKRQIRPTKHFHNFTVNNIKNKHWSSPDLQSFPSAPLRHWAVKELFLGPHHHRLEPPQWRPGEGPNTWGLQTTDCHSKHHLIRAYSSPVASIPKVRSCNVWNQDQMSRQFFNIEKLWLTTQTVITKAKTLITTQTPSTGLRHPSFNHCRIKLRHRVQKTVSKRAVFCWCSDSSKFVTYNSDYIRRFFL